ncbi:MAG TPA: hypothetical protein PLI27_08460 [Ignavibacteriales bacterium]|nr:hypothetical protein [Ignavibacteriales bacterium]HOM65322.1 hypothetical protein [Ignavibacteriales bacterium]HPD68090.1 hypothetical protein [Ignavibacteriales bacterium]HPP34562.1 hypothetical protein [Ignavibacteriales bacterium]HRR18339.1 hypothetical protein [Ignavibacteriales bacterium]
MNLRKFVLSILFLTFLTFVGCEKDDNSSPEPLNLKFGNGVLVINDGRWGQNNATVTFYNYLNDTLYDDLFYKVNQRNLGDVANSFVRKDDKGYIVVSNSHKIEVVNLNTFKSVATIDLAGYNPRHMVIEDNYGYVTSLDKDKVVKINLTTYQKEKEIAVGSKPEGIVKVGDYLYVANSGYGTGKTVTVISTKTDAVVKTLTVALDPQFLAVGSDNNVYVVCTGDYADPNKNSGLWKINTSSNAVVDSIILKGYPTKIAQFKTNQFLVTNSDGVVKVDISTKQTSTLIPMSQVSTASYPMVYSVAYDNVKDIIYCANPKDFKQNGEIIKFSSTGTKLGAFNCGINPGTIAILR